MPAACVCCPGVSTNCWASSVNLDIARLREQARINGEAATAIAERLAHVLTAKNASG
jgi:hypothetical protein